MIPINYDLIDQWLKKNKITRRKLCSATGISESTLATAFKRKSKMQIAYVWRIADFMDVPPADLLLRDENGNVDHDDWERVHFGRTEYEIATENDSLNLIIGLLKGLNHGGLEEAGRLIGLLWEIPRFHKDVNEFYDGSPDYWKKHPYQKQVKPFHQEEDETDGQPNE